MTKLSNITRKLFALSLIAMASLTAVSQNYYDDDIYYDASKNKKEQKSQTKQKVNSTGNNYYVVGDRAYSQPIADYPSADTYSVPAGSLDIDVDTYNRRGQFLVADSVSADSASIRDFAYTQRIERFHNPDIVTGSNDGELQEVYAYAMQQPQNINIYVIDNDPWNYYGPSWSWRYGNPWYWNTWGPSWSWNWGWNSWGWDPYWSWSWNWGPSWGCCPTWGWGHGWGPVWSGPVHAWRPTTPSGSSRPHRPVGGGSMATHRPGSYSPANAAGVTNRPGNMGRGRYGSAGATTTSRPGNYAPAGNNNGSSSGVRPGNAGRGRSAMTGSSSNSSSRNSYNNRRNNYNSNNNGYRSPSNSNGSFRSSGGSSTRGYSGSHGSVGGGSSRGGGSTSRGRR